MRGWILGLVLLSIVIASGAAAQTSPSGTAPQISFAKMAGRIPAGTPWAHLQYNDMPFPCRDVRVLTWDSKSNEMFLDPDLERIFRAEIATAGMAVSGDPTNLFEQDRKSSDIQVGALVTALEATFCAKKSLKDAVLENDRLTISGSARMTIEWQVYSALQGKVIARVPTTGSYETKAGLDGGNVVIIQRAFADSVRALASNSAFRQAVMTSEAATLSPRATSLPILAARPGSRTPAEASSAVAQVFVGEATGSAFLISPEGYLLTNHHVVGDASRVRLRWSDRTEVIADVVRSDRRRDVALLHIASATRSALTVRRDQPAAGEPVIAIGTPLSNDFLNTVTRGVVSGGRVVEGQSFVQSDVAVDHGNSGGPLLDDKGRVIAITDWGYAPDGVSHNLNFFIPIDDALKALAIDLVAPAVGASHR
jgi:serine protease Do